MADRRDYFFRMKVQEAELDDGFDGLERADFNLVKDAEMSGVWSGLGVQEETTPDLTVDVGAGDAYDKLGRRASVSATQNVDMSQDSNSVSTAVGVGGNEKIISLFVEFDRTLSDQRLDGNSQTVFFKRDEGFKFLVVQGAEASIGSAIPPSLDAEAILIADVTLIFGQTQIFNADIDTARREDAIVIIDTPNSVRAGNLRDALQTMLTIINDHITQAGFGHDATAISYAGGPAWKDTTTNPATDVQAQLDKIIGDLVADAGSDRIGSQGIAPGTPDTTDPATLTATSIFSQLRQLLDLVNGRLSKAGGTVTEAVALEKTITLGAGLTSSEALALTERVRADVVASGTAELTQFAKLSGFDATTDSFEVYAGHVDPGSGASTPVLAVAINATYDGTNWSRIGTGNSFLLVLRRDSFLVYQQIANSTPWANGAWDSTRGALSSSFNVGNAAQFVATTSPGSSVSVFNSLFGNNMPKCHGKVTVDGAGTGTLDDGFNTTGIAIINGTGTDDVLEVTIAQDMADGDYTAFGFNVTDGDVLRVVNQGVASCGFQDKAAASLANKTLMYFIIGRQ